ncbi:DUF2505 domain-containing protein [Pseudonocardia humida]|uniref:DUF2505 domain-containing protein n=1 Tax=Pseudonocardia humida TaxID=2800819 RepID=A0ABT1A2L7_9PSEU|nr:DUF2505 domain-containing protein [Pseudonocardia humida]MCO1657240.1 DUF2505 domain-containing protein [Pseudonocardia humida]
MPRPIDHRSTSPYPADRVYAVMADPEYLRARLARMGGKGAELLEHSPDGDGVRYRLRQGLDRQLLPPLVQTLIPGDLMIERAECLRPDTDIGGYRGDVDVRVPGTPVAATGAMRLADAAAGSEFAVRARITVNVPFLGGKLESMIAEQVVKLLAAETGFTEEWLARRPT